MVLLLLFCLFVNKRLPAAVTLGTEVNKDLAPRFKVHWVWGDHHEQLQ